MSTLAYIREILRAELYVRQSLEEGLPREFDVYSFETERVGTTLRVHNASQRKVRARDWRIGLKRELLDPASHLQVLDKWYSKLLECHFQPAQCEK
jgi:hypothetical protein